MVSLKTISANILRALVPILIFAVGVGGFLVFGKRPESKERAGDSRPGLSVEVAYAAPYDEPFVINLDGVSAPYRQVTYAAEVSGRIKKKSENCRAGHFVQQGEFLMQIDETDTQLEVKRLEAQFEQANESINEVDVGIANAEALRELAEKELEIRQRDVHRAEQLIRQGAINENEIDDLRRAEIVTRNSVQTLLNQHRTLFQQKKGLQAASELVNAQLQRALVDLKRTTIASPISGGITEHFVEEGDYVRAGDPLVRIHDTTRVEVKCSLELRDLYWIWLQSGLAPKPGTTAAALSRYEIPEVPVEVAFSFQGSEFIWRGKLSRYEGTGLNEKTRTLPCRVLVDNPDECEIRGVGYLEAVVSPPTLLTGLYVDIRVPIQTDLALLQIPEQSLRPGGKVHVVRDGKLRTLTVAVARSLDDSVLIRRDDSSLSLDDQIIVSPLPTVIEGMAVSVVGERDESVKLTSRSAINVSVE